MKTTTDNSSSRFNFSNENYTGQSTEGSNTFTRSVQQINMTITVCQID